MDDRPSALGSWSYEVADTKLARRAKPYFIVQLAFHSELLARVQSLEPERIHVILGPGECQEFRLAEFAAYFRHVRAELLATLADGGGETYPDPVEHCRLCGWRAIRDARRVEDDHLSLVADITAGQRRSLAAAGISTPPILPAPTGVARGGVGHAHAGRDAGAIRDRRRRGPTPLARPSGRLRRPARRGRARRARVPRRHVEAIGREELRARLASGEVVLVDVRPAEEFAAGHVEGSRSIPLAELERRLAELPSDREVVAYCRGPFCAYAHEAVRKLEESGRRAQRLEDGWPEWRLADPLIQVN